MHLQKLLRSWKDRAYFLNLDFKYTRDPIASDEVPYTIFEKHLLDIAARRTIPRTDDLFWSQLWRTCAIPDVATQGLIAYALEHWARFRRIFSIQDDLRFLLDATCLDDVIIGEIEFPFSSFVLDLESPFIGAHGHNIRTILVVVERDDSNMVVHFVQIRDSVTNYSPVSLQLKQDIVRAIKSQNLHKFNRAATAIEKATLGVYIESLHTGTWSLSATVEECLAKIRHDFEMNHNMWQTAGINPNETLSSLVRLTLGLCLYLK